MRRYLVASFLVILLSLVMLVFAATAQAAPPIGRAPGTSTLRFTAAGATCASNSCKVLSAVALNATASTRTVTLPVAGYSRLTLQVELTRVAATDVQVTCTGSINGGGTYAQETSVTISAGTGTLAAYHDVFATTTSQNFLTKYDVRGIDKIACVLSGTSAGATDLIDVYALASVGQ
jgi:hypothetical protein